ncbi:hypothetical protein [Humisphaera borealis]|uniref:Uncharacterized protein n=1 Tax=Humisphaera borealis TaxID=2807512 RepID=A0A7M2WX22_9BACT|nr:hypothetical protein [Humisphaera borealis]QOV90026.1 hypothetical protein IPV69_01235 [Humisphaera borealis]
MPIRQLVIAFAVLSLALVVGCDRAPTHESVMEQQVTTMEDVAKLLTTVTDEASANSAKPKLKELSEKLKAVKAEADKIAKPTKEKEDELRKKYEERITKAMSAWLMEMGRIGRDPKLRSVLSDLDLGK